MEGQHHFDTLNIPPQVKRGYRKHLLDNGCPPALSQVAISCLHTMRIAADKDGRQEVPPDYIIPSKKVRELRARLILEEALETIKALGFCLAPLGAFVDEIGDVEFKALPFPHKSKLNDIIDGCCDTIYVAVGTLCAVGAPDLPHLAEVCRANNAKFPGGVAITDPKTGKFLKPKGWTGPDHDKVRKDFGVPALNHLADFLSEREKNEEDQQK
jgi:predicted HAD superfamily Cof-like phosphohydrolase